MEKVSKLKLFTRLLNYEEMVFCVNTENRASTEKTAQFKKNRMAILY